MVSISASALGDGELTEGQVVVQTDHIGTITKVSNHIGISQSSGTITGADDESIVAIAPTQGIGTGTAIQGVVVVTTIEFVVTSSPV